MKSLNQFESFLDCRIGKAKPVFHFIITVFFLYLTGRASIYILRTAFGLDWSERIRIIYAGDDNTDEDAMLVIIKHLLLL